MKCNHSKKYAKNMCRNCYISNWWKKRGGHCNQKTIVKMHEKRFGGLREEILKFYDYKCCICGMTDDDHQMKYGREITLDHIDGRGRYSDSPNNKKYNLWVLCLACHGRRDSMRGWVNRGKIYDSDILNKYRI